ncbi:MAG: hypothetical protein IJL36_03255 [Clostridia bacterium]|nr:hypothetical protein [Clostridia bacterium]
MVNRQTPQWCEEMKKSLLAMAGGLEKRECRWTGAETRFRPEDYGYEPGTVGTRAIQQAIDAAAENGGIVCLENGEYLSGTLVLRSGVCLYIGPGACLKASTDLRDFPEMHAKRLTVQDTSMGMHQSLIFAEDCEHVALCGEGVLDGQGSPDNFPGEETAQGTPGRPFMIRMIDCRDVLVSGLTMKNSPCWMQNYLNCDRLTICGITVRNHANYNNDGMDIDGCRDVLIRHCRVTSGDDALCFKGASMRPLERVLVEDCDFYSACNAVKVGTDTQGDFRDVLIRRCRIGGLAEDPSGLKHACADSGISLESEDGGTVERFWLEDIEMTRVWSPFFLRLENRGRVRPGDPAPGPGAIRQVRFDHIRGTGNGPRGSYILGIPEARIRDILFRDIELRQKPYTGEVRPAAEYPEFTGLYPDAHMIDGFGPAPAYGLWVRHADGIVLDWYRIIPDGEDSRPGIVMEAE